MKWMGIYLLGYVLLLAAVLLTLWKTGILATIAPFWIVVGCSPRSESASWSPSPIAGRKSRSSSIGADGASRFSPQAFTIERMFPSGSLNQATRIAPETWTSPSRVVFGKS